ncbi:MAG TPA: hypothetical protein DCM86_01650 [Verrucomicrobiales bacterium]|nr:hypothetical protein [Verrucomicrobiales bacterium]
MALPDSPSLSGACPWWVPRRVVPPLASLLLPWVGLAEVVPSHDEARPPELPPALRLDAAVAAPGVSPRVPTAAAAPSLYLIGDPTDEEQLYLEYINRSRADPAAEGLRLATTTDPLVVQAYRDFSVDLALLQSQFNLIPAAPPLAMNARLLTAARLHSQDMFDHSYQGHTGSDGSSLAGRLAAQGYPYITGGENVYAYSRSVWHGHAGFNVDWGTGVGGMQSPPGHRSSIAEPSFREIGVGVVNGVNGAVGPQVVTQDFGSQVGGLPLLTGVAYYDWNGNGTYDLGEGLGGVSVQVAGASQSAVTTLSGGYAIPLPADGTYAVTFKLPGAPDQTSSVTVSGLKNVKRDFTPPYVPPVVSGPLTACLGLENDYDLTPLAGAVGYDWEMASLLAYTTVEGAENGLTNVTLAVSPGYSVVDATVKAAGKNSFHLAHPSPPVAQRITLNDRLLPSAASQLTFQSRLGYAEPTQVARAEVSLDGGVNWVEVWSKGGSGGMTEAGFTSKSVPLGAFAGQVISIRFSYDVAGGGFYPQTDPGVGFYVDSIAVTGAQVLVGGVVKDAGAGPAVSFTPSVAGAYLLRERARLPGRLLPWGPVLVVAAAQVTPPVVRFSGPPRLVGQQIESEFTVVNYRAGLTFHLLSSPSTLGPWSREGAAVIQTLQPGARFSISTPQPGSPAIRFYRVSAN